jgi:hypothetical protein
LAVFNWYDELLAQFPLIRESSNLVVRVKTPVQSAPALQLAALAAAAMVGYRFEAGMVEPPRMVPVAPARVRPVPPRPSSPPIKP